MTEYYRSKLDFAMSFLILSYSNLYSPFVPVLQIFTFVSALQTSGIFTTSRWRQVPTRLEGHFCCTLCFSCSFSFAIKIWSVQINYDGACSILNIFFIAVWLTAIVREQFDSVLFSRTVLMLFTTFWALPRWMYSFEMCLMYVILDGSAWIA